MADWRETLDEREREALESSAHPEWLAPMLATLTHDRFSSPEWIFEPKFDGERALAFRDGDRVRLMSRNRKKLNSTYPELAQALTDTTIDDFVLDGEIVAFETGISGFARLQGRMQISDRGQAEASDVEVYFYVFDLPYLQGYRLDELTLRRRKALLKNVFDFGHRIRYTGHRNEAGEDYHRYACQQGWEGVIAKRADSPYRHSRSMDWLKFKCSNGQELVIGGFTEPQGQRAGFGALLVGYYDDDNLRYAGKVGTGYDDDFLKSFRRKLDKLERKTCPFADEVDESGVHWVSPKLVGEFSFTEWTSEGKLRHPRFIGLRRDKNPTDVVREEPAG
jgi:DNA ligase D-like protein (predicted ligase)